MGWTKLREMRSAWRFVSVSNFSRFQGRGVYQDITEREEDNAAPLSFCNADGNTMNVHAELKSCAFPR